MKINPSKIMQRVADTKVARMHAQAHLATTLHNAMQAANAVPTAATYEGMYALQQVATLRSEEARQAALDLHSTVKDVAKAASDVQYMLSNGDVNASKEAYASVMKTTPMLAKARKSAVETNEAAKALVVPGYIINDGMAELEALVLEVLKIKANNTKEEADARLEFGVVNQIVNLGKFLHAIIECGKTAPADDKAELYAEMKAVTIAFIKMRSKADKGETPSLAVFADIAKGTWEYKDKTVEEAVYKFFTGLTEMAGKLKDRKDISNVHGEFEAKATGSNVTLTFQGFKVSLNVKEFCDMMKVQERAFFVDKDLMEQRHFTVLQRVVCLKSAMIDLHGLLENNKAIQVVHVKKGGKKAASFGDEDKISIIKKPIQDSAASKTESDIWLEDLLTSRGMMAFGDSELYAKHGYVQPADSYLKDVNIFGGGCQTAGYVQSFESIAKMVVREAKHAKAKETVHTTKMDFVVVGLDKDLLDRVRNPQAKVSQAERDTVAALVASFAAGCGGANKIARVRYGTHRQVGQHALGQKVVIGDMDLVVHPLFRDLGLADSDRPTCIIGFGSVKAAQVKASAGSFETHTLPNGVSVRVGYYQDVDTVITESAMTNAWQYTPENLMGFEAFESSFSKRVTDIRKSTLMKRVYEEVEASGKTAPEVIQELRDKGTIERKPLATRFNAQSLLHIRTQYGKQQADAVIKAAFRSNKGNAHARKVLMTLDLVNGAIPEAEILEVSLKELALGLIEGVFESAGTCTRSWSIKQDKRLLVSMLQMLVQDDKQWVRITGGTNSVLIPAGEKLMASLSPTDHAGYAYVEGLFGTLLESLWWFVSRTSGLEQDEFNAAAFSVSEGEEKTFFSKMSQARDKMLAGKELARIPTYGSTLLVCSSYALASNEMFAHSMRHSLTQAERDYNEVCGILSSKSPNIIACQARRVVFKDLVVSIRLTVEEAKIAAILDGTSGYVNAKATVNNGDDADGDKQAYLVLPISAFLVGRLAELKYLNPTLHKNNPTAIWSAEHTASEIEGLFVPTNIKPAVLKMYTYAEVNDALIKAGSEKEKVARYSASQMRVQEAEILVQDKLVEYFQAALTADSLVPQLVKQFAKKALTGVDLRDLAKTVATFGTHIQGGIGIQVESMDQIKQASGQVSEVVLAEMLSPTRLVSLVPATEESVLEDRLLKSERMLDRIAAAGLSVETAPKDRLVVLVNNEKNRLRADGTDKLGSALVENFRIAWDYQGLANTLGVDTKKAVNLHMFARVIAGALMWAHAHVGLRMQKEVSIACEIMREANPTVGNFTSRRQGCLETLLSNNTKTVAIHDCIQQQIVDAAAEYEPL